MEVVEDLKIDQLVASGTVGESRPPARWQGSELITRSLQLHESKEEKTTETC